MYSEDDQKWKKKILIYLLNQYCNKLSIKIFGNKKIEKQYNIGDKKHQDCDAFYKTLQRL